MTFAVDFASHHGCCQCQHVRMRKSAATKADKPNLSAPGSTATIYNQAMYIIAIGWLYVTVLMALTETSVVAGVLSFVFYGLAPTALLLWLFTRPARRKNRAVKTPADQDQQP